VLCVGCLLELNSHFHRSHSLVRVRRSVSFRDSRGGAGRVWSVDQADLSGGGGGKCFAEFRRNIETSWIVVVFLVFSNAFEGERSIDEGFVNVARLRGEWQITRTAVIPLDHGVRVCFYLLCWQLHNMVE
jgi:hypothetical protein